MAMTPHDKRIIFLCLALTVPWLTLQLGRVVTGTDDPARFVAEFGLPVVIGGLTYWWVRTRGPIRPRPRPWFPSRHRSARPVVWLRAHRWVLYLAPMTLLPVLLLTGIALLALGVPVAVYFVIFMALNLGLFAVFAWFARATQ